MTDFDALTASIPDQMWQGLHDYVKRGLNDEARRTLAERFEVPLDVIAGLEILVADDYPVREGIKMVSGMHRLNPGTVVEQARHFVMLRQAIHGHTRQECSDD